MTAAVDGATVDVLRRSTFACAPPPSANRLRCIVTIVSSSHTSRERRNLERNANAPDRFHEEKKL